MTKKEIEKRISFGLFENVKLNNSKGVAKIDDLELSKEKIMSVLIGGFNIKNIETLGLLAIGEIYDNNLTIKYYIDVYFNNGVVSSCEVIIYDLRHEGRYTIKRGWKNDKKNIYWRNKKRIE